MTRSVFLSTFLLAAVLSPITLQPYTCGPPPEQARLAVLALRVGSFAGENTIEGFNPNVFSYDVRFPESESVGVLWVKTNHPSTMVDVEYDGLPVQLVGQSVAELDVPLGISELAIHVTRRGAQPDAKTYVVHVKRVPVFPCTEQGIRDAIAYGGGPNYFDCDGPTQVPTAAELVIDNDVILDGEGNMIVDAGGGTGGAGGAAFMADGLAPKANGPHRVFSIPEGVTAELSGFTVTGGSAAEAGGGILNEGTFSLTNSAVTGNHADIGGGIRNFETGTLVVTSSSVIENSAVRWGGGIHSLGQADVIDSTVSANTAELGGGGLTNFNATMTVTGCTVADNSASGILNFGGDLVVTNTAVSGNRSHYDGGGISNVEGGMATLVNTTVSSNTAPNHGGGIANRLDCTATLTGSTVENNTATNEGGGIHNVGMLALTNSAVSGNAADVGGGVRNGESGSLTVADSNVSANTAVQFGGGIHNIAQVEIAESVIATNHAGRGAGGLDNWLGGIMSLVGSTVGGNTAGEVAGGIGNHGMLTVINTTVSDNQATARSGGGLRNWAELVIIDSTVSENTAGEDGGGIRNEGSGILAVTGTTVSANEAASGGGVSNSGEATLTDNTVSSNSANEGGGVLNDETGNLTVTRSTVSENSSGAWTGGIRNYGLAQIIDTTVSNNTAVNSTAGISNRPPGTMTVTGVTVSENIIANAGSMTVTNTTASTSGAGIANLDTGWMNMISATVSGIRNEGVLTVKNNIIDGECQLLSPLASSGGNVESPGNTCTLIPPYDLLDVSAADLGLGPLADNGGPTATRALFAGSVAIDLVQECVNAAGFPLFLDQRGAPRPYGPACDSGAFELGAVPLPGDFCINDADRAVYESLTYVDGSGNVSTCTSAASSIAADCALIGCPDEVAAVIACFPNCSPDVIAAFDQCVASCTEGATGLSTDCAGCYGELAGCGGETCVPECAGGGTQPPCIDCLFYAGCVGRFDACTGLPGSTDCSAVPDLCEGVDCDDDDLCTEDVCNVTDGSCQHTPTDCNDSNECTVDTCDPAAGCEYTPAADGSACAESNECAVGQCAGGACALTPIANGTPCTGGTCQAGVCTWYAQDFELLEQANPDALSDDGWLVHVNVLDSSGSLKFSYGSAAPNGIGAISDIVTGEGGLAQGDQQLVVYSDYNCCWATNEGHFNGTDLVEQAFWQGLPIAASAIGKTVVFSFDAKRGNINDPGDPLCVAPNVCESRAHAFANTIDSGNVIANYMTADTTNLSTSWNRFTIWLPLTDPLLEGQTVQFGFYTRASNFEPSGVFYDNIVVGLEGR